VVKTEKNLEKVRFELRNKEYDSYGEVEQLNPIVRMSEQVRKPVKRYSSPYFHFSFLLTATNEEPKSIREAIDSVEGRPWKDAMVKEMESLHKNDM
jgi:hypothetical protein